LEENPLARTPGSSGIAIGSMGIGTWAWGERAWGFGDSTDESEIHAAFHASIEAGVNFFDTAEIYGSGESERHLGKFLSACRKKVVIATKYAPVRTRFPGRNVRSALKGSLGRLGMEHVDLYQIHWHDRLMSMKLLARGFSGVVKEGLATAVGVSKFTVPQMKRFQDELGRYDIPLASNQVHYNLLHREPEQNGVMAACRETGIALIAYSPIAMGVLSGKYTEDNPPPGFRAARYPPDFLERVRPLVGLMREIGSAHGGKTPSQVAINWVISKGAIPIPGAKNAAQATENCGALGWSLDTHEIRALEAASELVQL
jgi:aryl-alcohol dehydrogenase-like predicted oxidoreductase